MRCSFPVRDTLTLGVTRETGQTDAVEGETWYQAVVIGSSLGGIEALHTILSGLRTELRVPVVIANHLPPGLGRLSDTLSHTSRLPVAWAADGIRAEPGQVYLCPGRSEVRLEPRRHADCRAGTIVRAGGRAVRLGGPVAG